MRHISKTFPGVRALGDVNIVAWPGEILAICGENGAGKSTLMKVLSGVYPSGSFDGEIAFDDDVRQFQSIRDSERLGIIIIHQELALVPLLSIAENIFLGNETAQYGVIDWLSAYRRTHELLAKVGLRDSPDTLISDLGAGKQQLVEIAKALAKKVRLLILDEPTASLNASDSAALLKLLLEFKRQGITSILISHKLNEVFEVADRITILRDGVTVQTLHRGDDDFDEDQVIRSMVGRDLSERYPSRDVEIGDILFEVRGWSASPPAGAGPKGVSNIDLTLRGGEVVGIAGLMGAGRTELAMSLFGRSWGSRAAGQVFLDGEEIDVSTVPKAIAAGLAYVTEDRKELGLLLESDICTNISLANLRGVSKSGVIDDIIEINAAEDYRQRLRIRSPSIFRDASTLSGGNQQKVVLAKWLFTEPRVLIMDEPTRGIDVGAKYEIYGLIKNLVSEGKGVILISSEMPELLGIADRIYVMDEGRFVAEMPVAEASQEAIMRAIMSSRKKGPHEHRSR
jgi:putative multiple sugar transport system ATP-binding protein